MDSLLFLSFFFPGGQPDFLSCDFFAEAGLVLARLDFCIGFEMISVVSMDRLEVVLLEVLSDLLAEHGSLRVGGAEVDARPHSGVDNFAEHIREPLEAPRGT